MTLKSRLIGLVAILVLFATMAPSSFAQVQITIIPDIDNGDINTNNNALAASPGTNGSGVLVIGNLVATSPLTKTTLRISYPGPITSTPSLVAGETNNCTISGFTTLNVGNGNGGAFPCGPAAGVPSNDPIRITGASGVFSSMRLQPLLNTTSQRIEIELPTSASNSSSGSFRLVGVRINANGLTGAQTITAALNTSVNNYLLGSPSTGTVINTLNVGLPASGFAIGLAPGNTTIGNVPGNPGAGTATVFTNRNVARSVGSFILTEGCSSCWRTATQNGNAGAQVTVGQGTQIRLTFNNVPAGVTLTLSASTGTASSNSSLAVSPFSPSITSTANTATINFTGTSTTTVETLEVDYTVSLTTTAAVTTPGNITVTATMFPIGTGFDTTTTGNGPGGITLTGLPSEAAGYPTFTDVEVGPVTVVNIVPANTTLLMPYALTLAPFDTGLAIANTTADPFGTGAGGATPSAGTISLNFYPTSATGAGTPFTLTTSSTVRPGLGLSSDGTLAAGATWTVLLSQLLTAAGVTGNFTGYVFIQTNFLDAHGTATISDFRTYSLTAAVLVLAPPATSPRGGGSFSAEALNN